MTTATLYYGINRPITSITYNHVGAFCDVHIEVSDRFAGTLRCPSYDVARALVLSMCARSKEIGTLVEDEFVWNIDPNIYGCDMVVSESGQIVNIADLPVK